MHQEQNILIIKKEKRFQTLKVNTVIKFGLKFLFFFYFYFCSYNCQLDQEFSNKLLSKNSKTKIEKEREREREREREYKKNKKYKIEILFYHILNQPHLMGKWAV